MARDAYQLACLHHTQGSLPRCETGSGGGGGGGHGLGGLLLATRHEGYVLPHSHRAFPALCSRMFMRWWDWCTVSKAQQAVMASVAVWADKRLVARTFRAWQAARVVLWRERRQLALAARFSRLQALSRSFGPWCA